MKRVLVLREALGSGVGCPQCGQKHQLEDLKGPRVLREQCYFKCPGDGKEFEIVVRERIPDDLQPVDPEMSALPEIPADEPGTMGGADFLNEPASEKEDTGDEEEFTDEEMATDEESDNEEEGKANESFSYKALQLVRRGMSPSQVIDMLECGMEMGGGAPPAEPMEMGGEEEAPQIIINVGTGDDHDEDDMDPEMDSFSDAPSFGGMAPEPSDNGVAHGVAAVESRRR